MSIRNFSHTIITKPVWWVLINQVLEGGVRVTMNVEKIKSPCKGVDNLIPITLGKIVQDCGTIKTR